MLERRDKERIMPARLYDRVAADKRPYYTISLNEDQLTHGPIDLEAEAGVELWLELYTLPPQSTALQMGSELPINEDLILTWKGKVNYQRGTFDSIPKGVTNIQLREILTLYPDVGRVTLTAIPATKQYQFL